MSNREEEFMHVVRNSLETNGELSKIKSALRLKILQLVKGNDDKDMNDNQMVKFKEKYQTRTIDTMNLLIIEYLKWYGYQYTAEMFQTEANISHTIEIKNNNATTNEIPKLLDLVIKHIVVKKSEKL